MGLVGFGTSDKPESLPYSLDLRARVSRGFAGALELCDIVLVAED